MKLNTNQIIKSTILSVSKYALLLILFLQLSVPGFALTLGTDVRCALSSLGSESSLASILCIEDIEDEGINFSFKSIGDFSIGESEFFFKNNDLPKNYIGWQINSRSPPGS